MDAESLARARQEMFIAEGSDWCWWYGDDHSSDHDAEFDELFRRHLRNVYSLIRRPIPDDLFMTNISGGGSAVTLSLPVERIAPVLDGEETSYFEWRAAGSYQVQALAGAMHQIDRQQILSSVRFGFDVGSLYLRLDPTEDASIMMARGASFALHFVRPAGLRLVCMRGAGGRTILQASRREDGEWTPVSNSGLQAAAGRIVELKVPLALAGAGVDKLAFFVAVDDAQSREIERHPAGRPFELPVPDGRFAALNWTA